MTIDWTWWLSRIGAIVNSDFAVAAIAGALGAYAGARGAQIVISREQQREALATEITGINVATLLCFSIANTGMALKRQHVSPIATTYVADKDAIEATLRSNDRASPHAVALDLRTLSKPEFPESLLERTAFERITLSGRGLAAALELAKAMNALADSIDFRNALVSEFRLDPDSSNPDRIWRYFGIRESTGVVDERMRSSIEALQSYTDDVIFYAKVTSDDLVAYGKCKRSSVKRLENALPEVSEPDWRGAATLLPDSSLYKDWLRGFPNAPKV